MSNNEITTIELGFFTGQSALNELDLSNNRMTEVPANLLDPLINLQIMYV